MELAVIETQPGFAGVVVMVNRATGQAAASTYWESEADLRGSEHAAAQASNALTRAWPPREPVVDRYEVVLHK